MYDSVGIIPAAGRSVRFGGLLKELLPDRDGVPLIKRTVQQLEHVCTDIVIVTSESKITEHTKAVGNCGCQFRIQRHNDGLWGAILTAMVVPAEYYYFMMPDTVVEGEFPYYFKNFAMGLHQTMKPERFGVLLGDRVVDKGAGIDTPANAWGTLAWSDTVKRKWMNESINDHTLAINMAIHSYGVEIFQLTEYYDMASVGDYREYLR